MNKVLRCRFLLVILFATGGVQSDAQPKKTVSLNHIALYVKDLKKSTDFYHHIIGLDTIPEPFHDNRHTWFKIGAHSSLHIIQGAATVSDHEKNAHLCFTVPSVDDFVKGLATAGIPYEDVSGKINTVSTRVDGIKQVYFQDPDKYWVEINDDRY